MHCIQPFSLFKMNETRIDRADPHDEVHTMTAQAPRPFPQLPDKIEKIHIIGVCGTAMGSLAAMLKERGYTVVRVKVVEVEEDVVDAAVEDHPAVAQHPPLEFIELLILPKMFLFPMADSGLAVFPSAIRKLFP